MRHQSAGALFTTVLLTVAACGGDSPTSPAAPTPLQLSFDYSACGSSGRPLWLAFQDGTGAWTAVSPVNGVYPVTLTASKGGFATVWGSRSPNIEVTQLTRDEFAASSFVYCAPSNGNVKAVFAQVAGMAASDRATLTLGSGGSTVFTNGTATLSNVPQGPLDLVAYLHRSSGAFNDRILIRRGLNVAANTSLGTIDFASAEAVAPAQATVALNGLLPGEIADWEVDFWFGASCNWVEGSRGGFGNVVGTASQPIWGVPPALLRSTDHHDITIRARTLGGTGVTDQRFHGESFGALDNRSITLPPRLVVSSLTSLAGPYRRLQVSLPVASEFTSMIFYHSQPGAASFQVTASTAWLGNNGTNPVTITTPDFSQVAGWDPSWAPASQSTSSTQVVATSGNWTSATEYCVNGSVRRTSVVFGTWP